MDETSTNVKRARKTECNAQKSASTGPLDFTRLKLRHPVHALDGIQEATSTSDLRRDLDDDFEDELYGSKYMTITQF